jgi:hypothetical protein
MHFQPVRAIARGRVQLALILGTTVIVTASGLAVAAVAPPTPPATAAPTATVLEERSGTHVEATFGEPNRLEPQVDPDGTRTFRDAKIKNQLIQMITDVPKAPVTVPPRPPDAAARERISIAFHSLIFDEVVDALVKAQERGVKVLVVYDGDKRTPQSESLKSKLQTANLTDYNDADTRGQFQYCANAGATSGSCISQNPAETNGNKQANQHAKYALFSRTKDSGGTLRSYAAWISSANMTLASGTEPTNNAVTVYGATSFYNELRARIFNRALDRDFIGWNYLDLSSATTRGYAVGDTANAHAWASPDDGNEDPVRRQLDKFTATDGCAVRVMHNQFMGARGQTIARKLRDLRNPGEPGGPGFCTVSVLVGSELEGGTRTPALGTEVKAILCPSPNPYPIAVRYLERMHDKVMLVDARYGSGTSQSKVVYAGSHNFTDQALTVNDELFLKIGSNPGGVGIYNGFLQHFANAWYPDKAWVSPDGQTRAPVSTSLAGCPS